jgi:hypothetical protein
MQRAHQITQFWTTSKNVSVTVLGFIGLRDIATCQRAMAACVWAASDRMTLFLAHYLLEEGTLLFFLSIFE